MGQHRPTNVVAVPGTHSLDELSTWLTQIVEALASAEIAFRSAEIYHGENKIKIGLDESASLEDAENTRDELGIPASAIEFSMRSKGGFLGGDDLEDKWRPLVGGIQHQQVRDGLKCSIGFGTERDGEDGIILASHCTNEFRRLWGNDSAVIHQPVNPFGPFTNTVAEETIDPLGQASGNILCTDFDYLCRYSDAAYAELDSDEDLDLGHIAEPEDYNTIEVSPAYDTLEIDSDSGAFSVGDEIEFIGRTSGWEKGIVTHTCFDIIVEDPQFGDPDKVVVCAGEFEAAPGYDGPDSGDSGGPVFIRDGNNVELIGTIFFEEYGMFYFSRIGYIYYDLDTYATWGTCIFGC